MLVSMQDNPTKPVKVKLDRFASTNFGSNFEVI
jgi:hypothetical protein